MQTAIKAAIDKWEEKNGDDPAEAVKVLALPLPSYPVARVGIVTWPAQNTLLHCFSYHFMLGLR